MTREMAFGGGRTLQGRFGGGARFPVLRSVGAVLLGLLLAAAAACDAEPAGANAPAGDPAARSSPCSGEDFITVRVLQGDILKYARVEACGKVELTVHSWYAMEDFFRGTLEPSEIAGIFRRVRESGILEVREGIASDPARLHPTYGHVELRMDGVAHEAHYSLREAPAAIQELHQFLTNPFTCAWPRNPEEGDYVRSYPLDLALEVINPALPRFAPTAEELAAHPALEASLRESWRLFRAGPPGASWERGRSSLDPPRFFVDFEGKTYHVLVLEYRVSEGAPHE